MRLAAFVALAVAVIVVVLTIGVAASIRYGIAGRRVSTALVVLAMTALSLRPVLAPHSAGWQGQAITTLRAINAAQLMYSTSVGSGRYARTLDELTRAGLFAPREGLRWRYELRLIEDGEYYAAIAVPLMNITDRRAGPIRSFCVDDRGAIFQTMGRTRPELENGRCRDTSNPIQ